MSWAIQLVIALAIFAGGMGAGIKYHSGLIAERDLTSEHERVKLQEKRIEHVDAAAVAFESDKAKIRTEYLTITKEIERVVQNPVYRNVCFDPSGVQLVNAAISPTIPAGEPTPAVPGPVAAD